VTLRALVQAAVKKDLCLDFDLSRNSTISTWRKISTSERKRLAPAVALSRALSRGGLAITVCWVVELEMGTLSHVSTSESDRRRIPLWL